MDGSTEERDDATVGDAAVGVAPIDGAPIRDTTADGAIEMTDDATADQATSDNKRG